MPATATTVDSALREALAGVNDPEIHRPITDLGMVRSATVRPDGVAEVAILLTVAGCPLKDKLRTDITAAALTVPGVTNVEIEFGVMSPEQRQQLQTQLRGAAGHSGAEPVIPFAQPGSRTRVYAVASGKGGVGKSSVTVNLAAALASRGLAVGVVDADIYGHSVPRMLGADSRPTRVEDMIMPPEAHGVKVISIGMFTDGNAAVVWRGPMLHRALQQFLADVYWGDLDVLLLDLPPGTGDVAISLAQLLPNAEILIVTTPQAAAAVKHAIGMAVLAAGHGAEVGDVTHLLAIGRELELRAPRPGLAQVCRYQEIGNLEIALVHWIGFGMVDIVAIEVVAFLGHAPRPGKAIGVDGMDEHRCRVRRQAGHADRGQPIDLETRTAIAFDAMGAGNRHHDLRCVVRPHPGDVGRQRLPARSLGRIVVSEGRRTGESRRGQELVARLAIVGGEGMDITHLGVTHGKA